MTSTTADDIGFEASAILAHLGERLVEHELVGCGSTSSVWKVRSNRRSYALRIVDDERRVLDTNVDAFLRTAVRARGGRVAEPVTSSEELGRLTDGRRWSLDAFVPGTHPARGALPEPVRRALGETLAALHAVPATGFGRPARVERSAVIGRASDPVIGVAQRFSNPLPRTSSVDRSHPLLASVPDIAAATLARLDEVTAVVRDGHGVPCHSDLHERQLICVDGELSALIDFGDATILDRHWDLGSVRYFHGEAEAASVYRAYRCHAGPDAASADVVASFSIAVAMHHATRSALPGKGHRLQQAVDHVRRVVSR